MLPALRTVGPGNDFLAPREAQSTIPKPSVLLNFPVTAAPKSLLTLMRWCVFSQRSMSPPKKPTPPASRNAPASRIVRDPQTDKREQELNNAFHRLVSLLAKPVGPDLFQHGIEALRGLLGASYGAVVLKDDSGQPKEGIFAGTTPGNSKNLQTFLRQRKPLVDQVLESEQPLVIDHIPDYLNSISFPLGHPIMHTFIGVPITREQECFGCIYLCGETDDQRFDQQDLVVASSFCQALALVLSQTKERTERKRLQQERELLSQMGLLLSKADTIEKAAETVCRVTDQYWNWKACSVSLRRSGDSRFRYVNRTDRRASAEPSHDAEINLHDLPASDQLLSGKAVLVEPGHPDGESRLIAPVRLEGEVLSLIDIVLPETYQASQSDANLIERIANIVAPTLARCAAEFRNAAFLSLAFQLTAATTAEEAARTITTTADQLIGWDSCSVVIYHPERDIWQGILHMDIIQGKRQDVFNPYPLLAPPGSISRRTMAEGPQLILREPTASDSPGLARFGDMGRPSLSLMFVPFRVGTRVCGVFSIQSYTANAYNARDLQLLQALADYCAGAVERIRLSQGIPEPIDYPEPYLNPDTDPSR